MINPADLVAALVTALRDIPAYVTEMNGDASNIFAYEDQFPTTASVQQAIAKMTPPQTMVVFEGTSQGNFDRNEVWKHRISIIQRAYGKSTTLWHLFVNGIPASGTQRLFYTNILSTCMPMDIPSVQRVPLLVSQDAIIDFYQISATFTEIGDN